MSLIFIFHEKKDAKCRQHGGSARKSIIDFNSAPSGRTIQEIERQWGMLSQVCIIETRVDMCRHLCRHAVGHALTGTETGVDM